MSVHHPIVEATTQALKRVSGAMWMGFSNIHRHWRVRRRPARPPAILVVGSLRSGGTGKTDLVAWIAARHPDFAILVHPTGDEDRWLSGQFPGRVFVHRDLLKAFEAARSAGFAAAVSDGGLQDPALDDCPAICIDLDPVPNASDLLPFGRYRELSPRPRKDLVRVSLLEDLSPTLDTKHLPAPRSKVVAACSVARPQAFFAGLEAAGLVVVEKLAFGDHHSFPQAPLRAAMNRHPGIPWLVTGKDSARGELAKLPAGSIAIGRNLSPHAEIAEAVDRLTVSVRTLHAR